MSDAVTYQFEYADRLSAVFVGAGGHSYRNIYPSLQYVPVDLRAVCDQQADRAGTYARMFGAAASYTDHREMLERERPTVAFIVTGYHDDGRVQATEIAADCLRAGVHVWMEKPTAASVAEVEMLADLSATTGRYVMTGLKKIFAPAMEKLHSIVHSPEFGRPTSISVRYPQALPAPEQRRDLNAMRGFLDHIYHPAAILHYLMGPVAEMGFQWEPISGASVAMLRFASGAVGTLHLAAGIGPASPLERVEVIGDGANAVLDNGVKLTYYRRGSHGEYGRTGSFLVDDAAAPLHWEPEFSLGQLSNKNLFYLGYVPELQHFCDAVRDGRPPEKGTLADSLAIMRLFDAYRRVSTGESNSLPLDVTQAANRAPGESNE
ncbi:Gfo/Idh/MocA family protein [Fodinicola acaciae]|uniref:Gfo/Idh/MocA family protein n=1 Tax=Fodinicola acaciae TaxID=2681555 RepID=UPI0013D6E39D|nr:Gfo/Idh/MocA family oxidoreductase [Fodinicola acaciae]